jgi:hypothetical protein
MIAETAKAPESRKNGQVLAKIPPVKEARDAKIAKIVMKIKVERENLARGESASLF